MALIDPDHTGTPAQRDVPTFAGPAFPPPVDPRKLHLQATLKMYWHGPFQYEREGAIVIDTRGNRIVDIPGFGLLTGSGSQAHGLPEEEAEQIQDEIGEMIARFLNGEL